MPIQAAAAPGFRAKAAAFEDAVKVFEGPTLEKVDDRFDYGETRMYAIGVVNGIEITVIYTQTCRGGTVESFQRGGQNGMKEKRTGRVSGKATTDWNRVRSLSDRQIREGIEKDPEAQPTEAEFWKGAKVVMPATKQTITIRLDADLLEWLRKQKGLPDTDQRRTTNVYGPFQGSLKVWQGGHGKTAVTVAAGGCGFTGMRMVWRGGTGSKGCALRVDG